MFDKLITESMGKSPWLFHINAGSCNGCDIELVAVLTPRYDAERLGFKLAGSPRQADIVVVTGPITKQSLPRVLRAISQVPEPRCIVTMGGSGTALHRDDGLLPAERQRLPRQLFGLRPAEQVCACRRGRCRLHAEARSRD